MKIILMGPPGAGKGTQARVLAERLEVPHISTGEIFRQAIKEQTDLGQVAGSYMINGALVPDDITIGIVRDRLANPDCGPGFVFDGFPRTEEQAKALDCILTEMKEPLDAVVSIRIDNETLIRRLSGRRTCTNCAASYNLSLNPPAKEDVCDLCGGSLFQRDDDKEETVRQRLEIYGRYTEPLLHFYETKGLIADIDGNRDKDLVTEAILAAIYRAGANAAAGRPR